MVLLFISTIIISSSQAQKIPLTQSMTVPVAAVSAGEPGPNIGTVFINKLPKLDGDKAKLINDLKQANIPNHIIMNQRVMGNGLFSTSMASLSTAFDTARYLKQRADKAPSSTDAIVIKNTNDLEKYRPVIKDNSQKTIIFQGNMTVDYPILIGSDKTIWIDGELKYNGVNVYPEGGAEFTPRPLKNDGLFSIRHECKFKKTYPEINKENMKFNDNLMKDCIMANKKYNVILKGTKRGKLIVELGADKDEKQKLPKANGIVVLGADNITIEGVTIIGALNGIYLSKSYNVNIKSSFIHQSVYRGIHLHSTQSNTTNSTFGRITNNLITYSKFDGIDIDSHSAGFLVKNNWIIGARDRYLLWTEIDANNNIIEENIGVILGNSDGQRGNNTGGFQEAGTEPNRVGFKGTYNNQWLNNHIFYAEQEFDGFIMRAHRMINFETITFKNNYVWTTNKSLPKHNPKINVTDDVFYLSE